MVKTFAIHHHPLKTEKTKSKLGDWRDNNTRSRFIVVMELGTFNNVWDFSRKRILKREHYREKVLRSWFRSLTECLYYMHDEYGPHGNIKPQNILVFGDNPSDPEKCWVKLSDYGPTDGFLEGFHDDVGAGVQEESGFQPPVVPG